MSQVVRPPDLGRYVDTLDSRVAALERQLASPQIAGGELRGTYPNPTLGPREGSGRKLGVNAVWSGNHTSANVPTIFYDADLSQFKLGPFTPTVDCWWPVYAMILVRTPDATWVGMNIDLFLTPADANGQTTSTFTTMQHAAAGPHSTASPNALWSLTAGIAYTCDLRLGWISGFNMNWYCGGNQHTFIGSPGVMPR